MPTNIRRYVIASAVQQAIGAQQTRMVRAGQASDPVYLCLLCDQDGDARREDTTVILMRETSADILSYAHARCMPSQVTTMAAVTAGRHALGQVEPRMLGVPDLIVSMYGPYAALLADEPVTLAVLTGDDRVNIGLAAWIDQGLSVAVPGTPPPPAAGWVVQVRGGRLHAITVPGGGSWWEADDAGRAVALPGSWLAAAREHGQVALVAGDIGLTGAAPDRYSTLTADAMAAGKCAYGLAALTEA